MSRDNASSHVVLFTGFTGIDQQYEHPTSPEVVLKAGEQTIDDCVQQLVQLLVNRVSLTSE